MYLHLQIHEMNFTLYKMRKYFSCKVFCLVRLLHITTNTDKKRRLLSRHNCLSHRPLTHCLQHNLVT